MSGLFIIKPEPVTVFVGENATMLCRSDEVGGINWEFRRISSTKSERICYDGKILDEYTGKYSVDNDSEVHPWTYNLIIHNVNFSDAGEYICFERAGLGKSTSANLTVQEHGKDDIAV